MGFLDKNGLSYLWQKITSRYMPTKALTKSEYNALSEEEKMADVEYIITDDNGDGGGTGSGSGVPSGSIKYKGQTISGGSSLPPGGATDQILAKASDADGDVKWVNSVTMEQVNNAINTAINGAISGVY